MRPLFLFLFAVMLTSCAPKLSYYTGNLQGDSGWSAQELSKIQFYNSADIVLWRELNRGESRITNGKIKMVNGREVEEVVIKKGTPGVYLFSPNNGKYAIGFDSSDDSKFLVFGPSDQVNGRYVLLAKDWQRNIGQVTYGDKVYNTSANSAYSFLMVDLKRSNRTKVVSEVPSGRKV